MAHLSGDETLLNAFTSGLDMHWTTAAGVFGVALEPVSSEQRRYAKVINFGLIYGMGSFGLAKTWALKPRQRRPASTVISSATLASKTTWIRPASWPRTSAMSKPCSGGACNFPRSTRPTAHDELVFEVPEVEVEWVRTEIPRLMAEVVDLKVPLLAEISFGPDWEKAY